MKWFYLIAMILVAGLFTGPLWVPGWLEAPAEEPYSEIATPNPEPIVRYDSYASAVKSIDAATCGDTTSSGIQGNFYEGLLTYHFLKRDPLVVVPQLAAALPEISDDQLTYTFKIKKNVLFQRNPCFGPDPSEEHQWKTRAITAGDFVLGFKRVADPHLTVPLAWGLIAGKIKGLDAWREEADKVALGDFSRYDRPVEGLEAVDDHTLRITLTKPFPQLLFCCAMHLYSPTPIEAVNYHLATEPADPDKPYAERREIPPAKRSVEFREADEVVGTGPYVLRTFKRKHQIVLVRNPDFRDQYYPTEGTATDKARGLLDDAGKKVPFIDVMQFDYVAESYARWMRFLSRQTDVSGIPQQMFSGIITPGKDLSDKWRKRNIYLTKYSSPAVYWIAFNMQHRIWKASPSLRRAMCMAFDVESYIDVLYNGRGKRAVNILPESIPGHDQAGPGPYYRYDRKAAKTLLTEARKELKAAGLLEEDGSIPTLEFDMVIQGADDQRRGEFFRIQFAKVGLDMKVIANDWPTLQRKVHQKNSMMYTMGWHADYPDAENFLQLFYSPNIDEGTNNSNYADPQFDAWYEQVRTMPPGPDRMALYVKMIRKISEDVPVLLLSEPLYYVLAYDWVKNYKPHPVGYGYARFQRIDARQRRKMGGR